MTSTAKNFAGQNLRGRSFKGQHLSGADFSGADLRGADFTDAILRGANFSRVRAGVQKRWLMLQLILSWILSALAGFMSAYAGLFVAVFLTPTNIKAYTFAPGTAAIFIIVAIFIAIIQQGFTAKSFGFVSVAATFSVAIVAVFSGTLAIVGSATVAIAGVIAVSAAGVLVSSVAVAGTVATTLAIVGSMTSAIAGIVAMVVAEQRAEASVGAIVGAVVTLLISVYVTRRTLKYDSKFDVLLKFGIAFAAIGGTSFRGAELSKANFREASLKSTNFQNSQQKITNLHRILWQQAQKLELALLGTSILANREVRELLVTGKPNLSKSYEGLNLRGANLDGVYLEGVNFKRAILSEASFRNANLQWVNLTEAQAIGTDFTGAQMTGVCLEGWSYDHTTKLNDVDCRFVFELEHPNNKGSRERRPHDPEKEFEQGDFTKRYSETLNVVQLLMRNGINREAFIAAWEKLTKEYPDINPDDIQEIKKKGQDVELTIAVPEDTDKGRVEHIFDSNYETQLKEIESKHQARLLEEKDRTIETMKDMYFALAEAKKGDVTVITQTEAKSMAEQNPVTFTARDITNSVVNLGKIKGNVTNAINQIPNKEDSGDIKTLLTQLQEAISADKDLADEDKADALEQVENLAKIALHDKPAEKPTLASKALRALKRIIDNIPAIAKIVETVGKAFGA
ncbi:pentapeptide repeat-containing protein [Pseudanabaena sp. FACHB-1277]|uniref:Pentapeptide repeat-containing protein n=1 Tax=Pseudanabaena cinerea FACHB-1277 TaxID=2949581 RepID=A0A926US50_9CYAN|nr:pentapeptide repeat-containing protein [Pseudanabaena cinerea]MBD2150089.1 pentapeptide repeat-containing protein [Pseudanabaena cinerea FACHB-1277]